MQNARKSFQKVMSSVPEIKEVSHCRKVQHLERNLSQKSSIIKKKPINGTFARNLHKQIAEDTYLKDAYMTKPD